MNGDSKDIDVEKVVKHWIDTSGEDFNTALTLYNAKSYTWSLFLGHISVEKLFKAYYVKKYNKHAPYIHNLFRLAELNELELTEEYSDWLDEITSFNLNARYNDFKKEFNYLCTAEYTEDWIGKIRKIRKWLIQML